MLRRSLTLALALSLPLIAGCPEEAPTDPTPPGDGAAADATDTGAGDGGVVADSGGPLDGGTDPDTLPVDDGVNTKDVGGDVADDAVADAAQDAGQDATPDTGQDATPDVALDADDAGDVGTDVGVDGGGDPCDPDPCTEPPAPACLADGVTLVTYGLPAACTADGATPVCDYAGTPTDCSADGKVCADGACVESAPLPQPGELVITEIMINPHFDLSDNTAEWIEVKNVAGAPRGLFGCVLSDDAANTTTFGALEIPAGGEVLLASSATDNGGLQPDALFSFGLGNGGDSLTLTCGGQVIDTVTWGGDSTMPVVQARASALAPEATDATLNDDGANWCASDKVYYSGTNGPAEDNYGTPGAPNPPCPVPDLTVDWCRLQWPLDAEVLAGTSVTVYGRVYDEGVTDLTDGVDPDPMLVGQAGYGPDASDPDGNPEWVWAAAIGNPGWSAAAASEPGNDEYEATFTAPTAGTWDHAFRFSLDGGDTWTTCDRAAGEGSDGSEDGYQIANAGSLVTLPSPCSPNPCNEPPQGTCLDGFVAQVYQAPGACSVDDTEPICEYATTTVDCGALGGTCADGACVGVALAPAPGEVIVTEIMYNPHYDLTDTTAEWFELTNVSGGARLLTGCKVGDDSGSTNTVGELVLGAGDTALFVKSATENGGLTPDGTFTVALGNSGDSVILSCGGTVIDEVAYSTAAGFPSATARSLSLDPGAYDATANDDGANWCLAEQVYYQGTNGPAEDNYGTPGAQNPPCPVPDTTVDWCRLQWPLDAEVLAGTPVTVYGRVYDGGITDLTDAVDPDADLVGQAGFGPDGSDPVDNAAWTWKGATPNATWDAATAGEPGNDEYEATFTAPSAGTYDHAFRFSLDGGATWTYCDRAAGAGSDGSEDGYQIANAGSLVTLPSPCDPNPCTEAPAAACTDGVTLKVYSAPGTCAVDGVDAVCTFSEQVVDCAATLATCEDGACVGGAVAPAAGEVIVTEILYDTNAELAEDKAEWFELANVSDHAVVLDGCTVVDSSSNTSTLGPVVLVPGEHVVLGRTANTAENGGLDVAATFGFGLNNGGDSITLSCDGVTIDAVSYPLAGLQGATRYSLSLDPGAYDAALNDDGANWCLGQEPYYATPDVGGNEHFGSPGFENPACPVPDPTVDWCRLQWPLDAEVLAGTSVTIYGRVYDEGVTDLTNAVDADPLLVGQAGYGPDGTDPAADATWVWTTATANASWDAASAGEPGNDEYEATLAAPAVGTYDHAFRFSLDGGASWTYCDRAAGVGSDGSEDGYQIANAGSLVTLPSPCDPNPCTEAPQATCADGVTLKTYTAPGACTVDGGSAACTYAETLVDCSATLGTCEEGACVGGATAPAAGQVIFTEVLYDPNGDLAEGSAEWFELTNLTAGPLNLQGCVLKDGSVTTTTVGAVIVPASGRVLFARSANPAVNGGLTVAQAFAFALNNDTDSLSLTCGGVLIDGLTYNEGAGWPIAASAALSLDPTAYDAAANDLPESWCLGADVYYTSPAGGNEHLGTPGAANPACPEVDSEVDWCRLQWPLDAEVLAGETIDVYGRVYDEGITDLTDGVDLDPLLVGQAGYGPDGSDPAAGGWTWTTAGATPGFSGTAAGEPDNDEYVASFPAPSAGTWDHAFRFSLDGGTTWTYCDRAAGVGADGSEDGYQIANAGALVTLPSPCDPNPCTEAPAAVCADGTTLTVYGAPGTCAVDGLSAVCTWPETTVDCAATLATCDAGACVGGAVAPLPGEIVVTEIMVDPTADLLDTNAEWFELLNTSDHAITLDGCEAVDAAPNVSSLGGVLILAGEHAVIARSANPAVNGGLDVAGTFSFGLNNGGDSITIRCGETVIDAVDYAAAGFPDPVGASLSLDPAATDAALNDDGASWCLGVDVYYTQAAGGGEQLGSPGAPNPACPVPDTTVDWCRLQWPLDAEVLAGESITVYGRVYDEGVTDLTDAVDEDALLVGQAGYGPDGSDPAGNPEWAWVDAAGNPTWSASAAGEPGNDEYEATFASPAAGTWDHAFRFSLDGGDTWTYCDRAAGGGSDGSEDGYQIANAGSLVTLPSPCDPNPCTVAPAPVCADGATLTVYGAPGTCAVDGLSAVCTWPETTVSCAATGATCQAGECVGGAVAPTAGQVIFTEILYDSNGDLNETAAEWFELTNLTAGPLNLQGCVLKDGSATSTTVGAVILPAQGRLVFARSANTATNGGLTVAQAFAFALNNDTDSLSLTCGGVLIDGLTYNEGAGWPVASSASLSLDPGAYDAALNDDPASWCLGTDVYYTSPLGGNEHAGTPGAENPACVFPDTTVDWCRLQWPLDAEVEAGAPVTIYGRLYEAGVTDLTDAVDPDPLLVGAVGYGPDGTDPAAGGWVWAAAGPNATWSASAAGEPGNDEYEATLTAPSPGTWDHAFRFSRDGGATWTYCDRAAGVGSDGSEDGYQTANAGSLVTTASPCDPNPCTVAPPPACADATTVATYTAPGTCTPDGLSFTCDYPSTPTDCALTGATCDAGACVGGAPMPLPGEVVISEILYDPNGALTETGAEWFEITSLADHTVSLMGCVLSDTSTTTATVGPLLLGPLDTAVFARSADPAVNGGLTVAGTFGFGLNNGSETLTISCNGAPVDVVAWDEAAGWPDAASVSLSLDPDAYDAALNDDPASWCTGADLYYEGEGGIDPHLGTPGALNPDCVFPDTTVDWCRLQWPLDAEVDAGEPLTIYGRVYEADITDLTDAVDVDPLLVGAAGYGPDGTDPATSPEWVWAAAAPNVAWSASAAGEIGNDEYEATLTTPAPGAWDHAFRFSRDGGATWTYCDRAAGAGSDGSEDGYQIANAGSLLSVATPCDPNPCVAPPAPACSDATTLVTYEGPGACTPDGLGFTCDFPSTATDCALTGGTCDTGACVGSAPMPLPGEVVITEILYDSNGALLETNAEWFEITSLANHTVSLMGCVLGDTSATTSTVGPLLLGPLDTAVFARSSDPGLNGGLLVAGTFSFALNNGSDAITITCDGSVVDTVAWDEANGWPNASSASLSLDPDAYDAALNDGAEGWCLGADLYYEGDGGIDPHLGTPGDLNPDCIPPDTTVDWCRLQWPLDAEVEAGSSLLLYGRVYEAGITDLSDAVDLDPALVGAVGYGPDGTDPAGNPEWTWAPAGANATWSGSAAGEADNDEYEATITAPTAGTWDHAFRFSRDGGATWTYCDRAAGVGADGSEDGYQIANAGSLLTTSSPCDPNPCTAPPAPDCADGTTVNTYAGPGVCTVVGAGFECAWSVTQTDCALTGATCAAGACMGGAVPPVAGEVVFTEIMYDTNGDLNETAAEWFEITSLADHDVLLTGCVLQDGSTTTTTVGALILAPLDVAVFARSVDPGVNGGIVGALPFAFALNNGNDSLTLTCDGTVVDALAYDEGAGWPNASSASLSLDPDAYDGALNDDAAGWCLGADVYYTSPLGGNEHMGTPGELNPDCIPPDTTVDWCRLQWPLEVLELAGTELTFYGRVYEAGKTTLTDGVDVVPGLVGQLGYGADGSDPAAGGWTWADAEPNASWSGIAAGEANNDEYQATITLPAEGIYAHAFRFSVDGGATWLYCDKAAGPGSDGAEDGYQTANAGVLLTEASPCDPNPCTAPPAAVCMGTEAVTYALPGTCSVVNDAAECAWVTTVEDCAASGETCTDGVCVGSAVAPLAGEVIVTEMMYNTEGELLEPSAEWFELHNTTTHAITLEGCVLKDQSTITTTIGAVVIAPLGYAVFAKSADPGANGGLTVAGTFAFSLNNSGTDGVNLTCGGVPIDSALYGTGFPSGAVAKSYALNPAAYDATSNDSGANWCISSTTYYTGATPHYGTPGADNDCP